MSCRTLHNTLSVIARSAVMVVFALLMSVHGAEPGEPVAVVVHKTSPIENLNIEELRRYCVAERRYWPHGRKVTIVLRESGASERDVVLRDIFGMNETEFKRHFLQLTFSAEVQSTPKELATGAGVRRFVFNVPGAIGFLRLGDVDASVKIVTLDGASPTNGTYRLRLPPAPPAAPAR